MHNKFVVIDSEVLITGSFNWTSQAVNSNQENLLILQNESLCELYQLEFEKLWL
jgi:cardiolipin hydrolase